MAQPYSKVIGDTLRQARRARGWTLRVVHEKSGGRYKPSSIGGYERGEREISVSRFCELALLYGVPPAQLLGNALQNMAWTTEVVIDLTRLDLIPGQEGRMVAEFIHDLKTRRGDPRTDIITLRAGDLQILATASSAEPDILLEKLRPALAQPSD
jgi:transcriptional regulator with XRE-family HTH domain